MCSTPIYRLIQVFGFAFIRILKTYGTKIIVNTDKIATRSGCEKLLKAALQLGPIGGIFNLAVLLRDSILENQTVEKFVETMLPKATATEYLGTKRFSYFRIFLSTIFTFLTLLKFKCVLYVDELSRKLAPKLRYFVVFSSVSCGRGNAGQSNYGMANSVMERIIERRQREGLPAKAIQWGRLNHVLLSIYFNFALYTSLNFYNLLNCFSSLCLQVPLVKLV